MANATSTLHLPRIHQILQLTYLPLSPHARTRPSLASHIHRFRVRQWLHTIVNNSTHGVGAAYTRTDIQHLVSTISRNGWVMNSLQKGSVDAVTSILLSLLHNLRELVLETDNEPEPADTLARTLRMFSQALIASSETNLPEFKYLEKVEFISTNEGGGRVTPTWHAHLGSNFDLSLLAPLFLFPAVRKIKISTVTMDFLSVPFSPAGKLTTLILANDTLQELRVSIEFVDSQGGEWYCAGRERGTEGCVGSFRGFQKLRVLEIPVVMLFGWGTGRFTGWSDGENPVLGEVLPKELRELYLRKDLDYRNGYDWYENDPMDNVAELWSARDAYTPRLKRAGVICYDWDTEPAMELHILGEDMDGHEGITVINTKQALSRDWNSDESTPLHPYTHSREIHVERSQEKILALNYGFRKI
ncbi:hypothetical protein K440DRAFT_660909 [Wilcoxina mikolae CBS 423.85]|nr:hypothetical protein K440DRAFT_660909 [Wilcoxina mikolae CBS 423.85]